METDQSKPSPQPQSWVFVAAVLAALLTIYSLVGSLDYRDQQEAAARVAEAWKREADEQRIEQAKEQRAEMIRRHEIEDDSNYMVYPIAQVHEAK